MLIRNDSGNGQCLYHSMRNICEERYSSDIINVSITSVYSMRVVTVCCITIELKGLEDLFCSLRLNTFYQLHECFNLQLSHRKLMFNFVLFCGLQAYVSSFVLA